MTLRVCRVCNGIVSSWLACVRAKRSARAKTYRYCSKAMDSRCVVWLNATSVHCTNVQRASMQIENIASVIVLAATCIFFAVSSVRRWWMLRERANTFYLMAIGINLFGPVHLLYYVLALDQAYGHVTRLPLPLMSFALWWGFVPLGFTFGPLIAAWAHIRDGNVRAMVRKTNVQWSFPLVLVVSAFVILNTITPVLMGYEHMYGVAARVYFGAWTLYLWACSVLLALGARDIMRLMDGLDATRPAESSRDTHTSSDGDARAEPVAAHHEPRPNPRLSVAGRTRTKLWRVLIGVVVIIFLPASVGTLLHACGLTYIDSHAWASGVVLCLYRACACAYVAFWGWMFWSETSYQVSTTPSSPST